MLCQQQSLPLEVQRYKRTRYVGAVLSVQDATLGNDNSSRVHMEATAHDIKTKTKTRPAKVDHSSTLVALAGPTSDFDTDKPDTSRKNSIPVKPQHLHTLRRLFPETVEELNAKPLDWRCFVTAMEDAGFHASNMGGSEVAFTREGEGRIVVHKPHPVSKIDQLMLQSWGKRMYKWFGWGRDIFVAKA